MPLQEFLGDIDDGVRRRPGSGCSTELMTELRKSLLSLELRLDTGILVQVMPPQSPEGSGEQIDHSTKQCQSNQKAGQCNREKFLVEPVEHGCSMVVVGNFRIIPSL